MINFVTEAQWYCERDRQSDKTTNAELMFDYVVHRLGEVDFAVRFPARLSNSRHGRVARNADALRAS
jgi:hypothetical protein